MEVSKQIRSNIIIAMFLATTQFACKTQSNDENSMAKGIEVQNVDGAKSYIWVVSPDGKTSEACVFHLLNTYAHVKSAEDSQRVFLNEARPLTKNGNYVDWSRFGKYLGNEIDYAENQQDRRARSRIYQEFQEQHKLHAWPYRVNTIRRIYTLDDLDRMYAVKFLEQISRDGAQLTKDMGIIQKKCPSKKEIVDKYLKRSFWKD